MKKEEIIEKLKEFGIKTTNCFPKKTFLRELVPVVALYERELKEDFYFYTEFEKRIYKVPKGVTSTYFDDSTEKHIILLSDCDIQWEDKPYEELEDLSYRDMTLRHYACIQLGVPNSGLPWLDELIKQKK